MIAASRPSGWASMKATLPPLGRGNRHELAFIRDIERVEAQQFAGGSR
jgi:hypothetical protein